LSVYVLDYLPVPTRLFLQFFPLLQLQAPNLSQQHGYLRRVDLIDQRIAPIVQLLLLLLPLSDPLCSDLLLLFLLSDFGAHLRNALPDLLELEIVLSPLRGDVGLQLVDV
jgi:hypothetical protein